MASRIVGIGIGSVESERFARALAQRGEKLVARLFSADECREASTAGRASAARSDSLAARLAAKAAARRALGLPSLAPREAEIRRGDGPPTLVLHGAARARADALGVANLAVSLSHDGGLCIGQVVLEAEA